MSRDKPGQRHFPCPAVPLSWDKGRSKCPGTNSSVLGRPKTKLLSQKNIKNRKCCSLTEKVVLKQEIWSFLLKKNDSFCQRGFCLGTFAPSLVPGQRDTGTRKFFCAGTKGQRDVPSRFVPGRPVPWKPYFNVSQFFS